MHNTYFTLPVLFTMISNHYAGLYGHEWNWVLLILISVAGALIRVWFVQRHKGNPDPLVLAAGPGRAGADSDPGPAAARRRYRPPASSPKCIDLPGALPVLPCHADRHRKALPPRPRA